MIRNHMLAVAAATLAAFTLLAQPLSAGPWMPQPDADALEAAYDKGTEALDAGKWEKALAAFRQVADAQGPKADAATYWMAYALNKLGRKADALARLGDLREHYSKSAWLKDGRALELEIHPGGGARASEVDGDEDLKLMALNGLMNSDPERALPLLEKFLKGNSTPKLKEKALFVLAQSNSARARQIVAETARASTNPELQEKAIQYLGLFGGKESRGLLFELYGSSPKPMKRKILQSFMLAGERERLVNAATSETDPELRGEAARQLGLMGAKAELWKLYQAEAMHPVKRDIVQGMFLTGDTEHLGELAKRETDPALRGEAIQKLGLLGGDRTGQILVEIYKADSSRRVKSHVLQAFFLQGNARALIDVARGESDRELKTEAVKKLSLMRSKEASDFMMEILEK